MHNIPQEGGKKMFEKHCLNIETFSYLLGYLYATLSFLSI